MMHHPTLVWLMMAGSFCLGFSAVVGVFGK
jgi:hypothetical protein